MLDGSLFSRTKPRTKQIYSIYSTYFLMYSQPVHDCTINIGTPCMYTFIFVIFDPRVLRKPGFIIDDVLKRAGNHLRFTQDKQNARGIAKFRLSRYDLDLQLARASSRFPFIPRRSPTLWYLSGDQVPGNEKSVHRWNATQHSLDAPFQGSRLDLELAKGKRRPVATYTTIPVSIPARSDRHRFRWYRPIHPIADPYRYLEL